MPTEPPRIQLYNPLTRRVALGRRARCAGLQSDRVDGMTDRAARHRLRIMPLRGDYYVLRPERADHTAIHVRNAPSPAATSSHAITDLIAETWQARVDA